VENFHHAAGTIGDAAADQKSVLQLCFDQTGLYWARKADVHHSCSNVRLSVRLSREGKFAQSNVNVVATTQPFQTHFPS
jgi:hypothetical protein